MKLALFLLLAVMPLSGCVKCYSWVGPYELTLPPGEAPTPTPDATPTP